MTDARPSVRVILRSVAWFFVALVSLALLSQPIATHDELYHATSIWCARGENPPQCMEIFRDSGDGLLARTNIDIDPIDVRICQQQPERQLVCPTNQDGESVFLVNNGLYPKLYYWTLSWFVVQSVDVSFVLTRTASLLFITILLGLTTWLLPNRYRLVLLLMMITACSGTGYFLFASINPSSWTAFGVGIGWLTFHAALSPQAISIRRRSGLFLVGGAAWAMALGSRTDSAGFVAFSAAIVGISIIWHRKVNQRRSLIVVSGLLVAISTALVERFSSQKPLGYLRSLTKYSENQNDNLTFFSHYLMHGVVNMLQSLGTLPTMSPMRMPEILYVMGLALVVLLGAVALNNQNRLQLVGTLSIVVVATLTIMAQVVMVHNRDSWGVEPRYSYPLLLVAVGWWFLHAPEQLWSRIRRYLKPAIIVSLTHFALTTFSVAERYADRQTFGLRMIPDGPDNWWWSWMPVGPNVVLVLSIVALWKFLSTSLATIETQEGVASIT